MAFAIINSNWSFKACKKEDSNTEIMCHKLKETEDEKNMKYGI